MKIRSSQLTDLDDLKALLDDASIEYSEEKIPLGNIHQILLYCDTDHPAFVPVFVFSSNGKLQAIEVGERPAL
jgi:hypothetical protein